ncbi:MAG TPA: AAA family ATPase [Dermatophilaceae bacterium]|nr:AAA family ATPase [Dermatophilaceae bacterium]
MTQGPSFGVTAEDLAGRPISSAQPGVVLRARLLDALLADGGQTVTFISGPAGAGKSTVVAQWAAVDPRPRKVLALSPELADPSTFARALVKALESLGRPARKTRALASAAEPAFSTLLPPALATLAGNRGIAYVLVVDDLHLLTDPACHALLAALVDGVPQGSQVAFMSREPAPTWLAPTRAQGRLREFGPEDLAFTVVEAIDLFAGMGLHVADHEVAKATEHAEGWAVALYLDALAVRDKGASTRMTPVPIPFGSDRAILDYLRWQVLDPLDDETRQFLMRTSVLEELLPALCDRILERADSARVLARVSQTNRLVVEIDSREHRYRYHHLLAEALHAQLTVEEPEIVAILHLRASQWFDEAGDLDSAIHHAKAAGDLGRVGELVWSGIGGCIGAGRPDRLQHWLAGLPDPDIASDRWLTLSAAWLALQIGDLDRRERWAMRAEGHAGRAWRDHLSDDPYAAFFAVLFALIGRCTVQEMQDLTTAAVAGLPPDSVFRPAATLITGISRGLTRDFGGAASMLADAQRSARALDVPLVEADAMTFLGMLTLMSGDVQAGAGLMTRSAAIIDEHDLDRLATSAHALTGLALAQTLLHETEKATSTLQAARRLTAQVTGIAPWFAVSGRSIQARTAALLGDGPMARQLIVEARAAMTPDLAAWLTADLLAEAETALRTPTGDGMSANALTAAEIRVLQFLPSHLTFGQIGEHLFLSGNTVKTHALAIYRKLGASTRHEAVTRARQLGLLEGPVRD